MRQGLCRLAGIGAETAFERRQDPSWPRLQSRAKRHSPAAYHGRHVAIELDGPKIDLRNIVASPHAGAQATDAGGNRIGQQDGPDDLGDVDETGRLSNPGNGNRRLIERLRKAQAGKGE